MSTPCLQITDVDDYYGGAAWFGFLGGAEISSGQVVIRLQIWLPEMDGQSCSIGVREHDSAAHTFIDLDFASDGSVFCYDENGSAGIDGTCPLNQAVPIRIAFDMTAGTYDVTLNGTPLVVGRAHGVTGAGIGSVLVGCNNDGNVGDHFYVDDLYVADGDPTPAEPASWGAVKTQFLGPE